MYVQKQRTEETTLKKREKEVKVYAPMVSYTGGEGGPSEENKEDPVEEVDVGEFWDVRKGDSPNEEGSTHSK